MPKTKQTYPEIKDIKDDLDSLKTNVVELTRHIKKDGTAQTKEIKKQAANQWGDIKDMGRDRMKVMERRVKDKPGKSVLTAFAVGLAASYFLRGRR